MRFEGSGSDILTSPSEVTLRAAILIVLAGALPFPRSPAATGCDKNQKPFMVAAESALAGLRVLALVPVRVPGDADSALRARSAALDTLMEYEVRRGGWTLIPARVTDSVWQVSDDSLGAMFDPSTGRPDSAKHAARLSLFKGAMEESLQADAYLYSRLQVVPAAFDNGSAKWDGAKQGYANFGKKFAEALGGHGPAKGRAPALSLKTALVTRTDVVIYENAGGIQLLSVPSGDKFQDVPRSLILVDTARVAGAVRIALCQLMEQVARTEFRNPSP